MASSLIALVSVISPPPPPTGTGAATIPSAKVTAAGQVTVKVTVINTDTSPHTVASVGYAQVRAATGPTAGDLGSRSGLKGAVIASSSSSVFTFQQGYTACGPGLTTSIDLIMEDELGNVIMSTTTGTTSVIPSSVIDSVASQGGSTPWLITLTDSLNTFFPIGSQVFSFDPTTGAQTSTVPLFVKTSTGGTIGLSLSVGGAAVQPSAHGVANTDLLTNASTHDIDTLPVNPQGSFTVGGS